MKEAGSAVMASDKAKLKSARRELRDAKGRPRLLAAGHARVQRIQRQAKPLAMITRGGPVTLSEHEMFLAQFV
jgi:hypothetical protein